jgi:diadenosine tetraphosphate (Ap4A) HIT family hydrolase
MSDTAPHFSTPCELCELKIEPVYRDERLAVILVDDQAYPGFCRVIWHAHVKEMSDLAPSDRLAINEAVWHVEVALRSVLAPDKVNVASLGNVVPHLHWHVIPRYADDACFPNPIWGESLRQTEEAVLASRRALLPKLSAEIIRRMSK